MKTSLLIATLVTTGLVAANVKAADEVEGAELPINQIEFGIGSVSDDAWKFGRYNGLYQKGPYFIGDIYTQDINEDGEYWSVRGTNLGLESRFFRLESGTQGKTNFFFEFDQQPNYINNTGKTPFLNHGSTLLTLPPGFIDDNVNSYLQPLELHTERQRIGVGLDSRFKNFWTFDVAYRHETKTGTSLLGGAMTPDSAGGAGLLRDTTGSLLPAPIDYETDLVDMVFRYAKDKAQFAIEYHGSMFKNTNESLTWQDPFDPVLTDYGNLALPPDNQLHQLSLSGGYQLAREYNLTGVLSIGRATQNETFQPYDTVGTNLPLPRDSLDGEVWQTNAQIRFAYRPSSKFRLDATYRFDDRDNQTAVANWNGVVADGSQSYNYENIPESYQNNQIELTGNWHIGSITNLRLGYQYDLMYREFASATEPFDFDTEENKLFAKLNVQPGMAWNLALYGETSDRKLNNYDASAENPYVTPYYIADRNRNQVGALVEYLPNNNWSFGAKAEYIIDDYDEAQFGLIETETPSFTLDAAYHPSKDVTTYAYYTREEVTSKQKGILAVIADIIPINNWQADFDDSIDTFGLGGKITGIGGKWDIGLDLVYNKSKGQIDIIDLGNSTTSPYPDLNTELASAKLWTQYNQSKKLSYRFYYWYEDYNADNWAVDGLQADSLIDIPSAAPGEFTDYLLTGEQTQDYSVQVIGVSLVYLFP